LTSSIFRYERYPLLFGRTRGRPKERRIRNEEKSEGFAERREIAGVLEDVPDNAP